MKTLKKFLLGKKSTIYDALNVINNNAEGIAFIVDEENELIGTVTDGDIRRGLLKGLNTSDNIMQVCNPNPKVLKENYNQEEAKTICDSFRIKILPVVNNKGQVIGYFENDEYAKDLTEKENKVLIMAGGLGTRLRPLTDDTPKPMLTVGGKPMLEIIINQFKSYGFKKFLISVNYKAEVIESYFGDGSNNGVEITYIRETKRMGTAGAIKLAEEYLNGNFFVINGDILTKVNFEKLLEFHQNNNYDMTIGSRVYSMQVPYGVLYTDKKYVTSLVEKPQLSFLVSGGVYVLNSRVLKYIPNDEFFDITELINILTDKQNEGKVGTFPIHEYWMDIGHLNDYYKANEEFNKYFNQKGDEA